jgi:CheY-like chemotaxis protein
LLRSHEERLPLIYFLVLFPVAVLVVFAWLVSTHCGKLFAPADSKNEENYVKMQLSAAASHAIATAKNPSFGGESDIARIVEVVQEAARQKSAPSDGWRSHILWVDDRPENNVYERRAFEAVGLKFTLALSTDDALAAMVRHRFAAVISNMGRKEGPREGYVLLDAMRAEGNQTPLFFTPAQTLQTTSERPASAEGKVARTMPKSCSAWLPRLSLVVGVNRFREVPWSACGVPGSIACAGGLLRY